MLEYRYNLSLLFPTYQEEDIEIIERQWSHEKGRLILWFDNRNQADTLVDVLLLERGVYY